MVAKIVMENINLLLTFIGAVFVIVGEIAGVFEPDGNTFGPLSADWGRAFSRMLVTYVVGFYWVGAAIIVMPLVRESRIVMPFIRDSRTVVRFRSCRSFMSQMTSGDCSNN